MPPLGVQVRPLLLELALLLLALQLGVVRALGARDPAPQQRDRVDLALDRGELVLHRLRGAHLARRHALVGVEGHAGGARHLATSGSSAADLERLAVAHAHVPAAAALARDHVADREVVSRGPLRVDEVRKAAVKDVGIQRSAGLDHLRHRQVAGGHLPQLHRPPPLAADAQPAAHHEAERARACRSRGRSSVRASVWRRKSASSASVGLVHARAAAGDRHAVAAQPRRRRAGRTSVPEMLRRRGRKRHEDQARGELGVVGRDPVERGALAVGLDAH